MTSSELKPDPDTLPLAAEQIGDGDVVYAVPFGCDADGTYDGGVYDGLWFRLYHARTGKINRWVRMYRVEVRGCGGKLCVPFQRDAKPFWAGDQPYPIFRTAQAAKADAVRKAVAYRDEVNRTCAEFELELKDD